MVVYQKVFCARGLNVAAGQGYTHVLYDLLLRNIVSRALIAENELIKLTFVYGHNVKQKINTCMVKFYEKKNR